MGHPCLGASSGACPSSAASTAIGAFAGLAAASALGYFIYQGSQQINLRLFFQVTGGLVIIVAAGLVSKGVHELQEAGVFGSLYTPVWDVTSNAVVGQGTFAAFLKGFVGWSAHPSIEQLLAWVVYVAVVGWAFYFAGRLPSLPSSDSSRPEQRVATATAEAEADTSTLVRE